MPTTSLAGTLAVTTTEVTDVFDLDLQLEVDNPTAVATEQTALTRTGLTAGTCGWTCTGTTTSPCAC